MTLVFVALVGGLCFDDVTAQSYHWSNGWQPGKRAGRVGDDDAIAHNPANRDDVIRDVGDEGSWLQSVIQRLVDAERRHVDRVTSSRGINTDDVSNDAVTRLKRPRSTTGDVTGFDNERVDIDDSDDDKATAADVDFIADVIWMLTSPNRYTPPAKRLTSTVRGIVAGGPHIQRTLKDTSDINGLPSDDVRTYELPADDVSATNKRSDWFKENPNQKRPARRFDDTEKRSDVTLTSKQRKQMLSSNIQNIRYGIDNMLSIILSLEDRL